MIVPFAREAVAEGNPVFLAYDRRKLDLLREWLGSNSGTTLVAADGADGTYANPARAIESYRKLFEEQVAAGATRIWIAGDAPHAGNGGNFHGWDRYESAVNVVWEDYPVRSVCLYDATTVPADVRDVVERTHPWLVCPSGERRKNPRYQDPSVFVGLPAPADLLEATSPLLELRDPTPVRARQAVRRAAIDVIGDDTLDDLLIAVSEAVTNANLHGRPPVAVRVWVAHDRVIVHVQDGGSGPDDPLAGLVPTPKPNGAGLGMWLTHQLGVDVALIADADGFTVRLRAGR